LQLEEAAEAQAQVHTQGALEAAEAAQATADMAHAPAAQAQPGKDLQAATTSGATAEEEAEAQAAQACLQAWAKQGRIMFAPAQAARA